MRILGIDPGLTATGYGLLEVPKAQDEKMAVLEVGTIEPGPKDTLQDKISQVYKNIDQIILQYTPDCMVVEKLYAHYKHPTTACIMGHVRGAIFLLSSHRNLRLIEYSVKRIRKAVLGNGGASKQQTREAVAHFFKIKASELSLDASDALALALGYHLMERQEHMSFKR